MDGYRAMLERHLDPDVAEWVARRAGDFYEEWFEDPEGAISLLQRIQGQPGGGWAFERLKLTYNLGERWDELFSLYDEVIARTEDQATRRELLEDAALAAKDLAADTGRAMGYFEALLALRDDARIRTALERLYERHGRMAYGLCRAMLRDAHEAEDATQQAFLSAYRALLGGGLVPHVEHGAQPQRLHLATDLLRDAKPLGALFPVPGALQP